MPSIGFTRDEVILALDVLYFSGEAKLNEQSAVMQDLSALLNRLPIHKGSKYEGFRNPRGIANQIQMFIRCLRTGTPNVHVGNRFFEIDEEFKDKRDELHSIAMAIRRNEECFETIAYGSALEEQGFPEGALLGHLHRQLETRYGARLTPERRCEICQLDTSEIYPGCPNLTQLHLTVPITALDGRKKYSEPDFISVCPNCHAALHRRRPWLGREDCVKLLD